jgi:RNA polymerase sigma factor (sigma-70 family)
MHKHNWTLYEKNPDWSICEECQMVQQRVLMEIPFAALSQKEVNAFPDEYDFKSKIEDELFTEQRLKELSPRQRQVCELILEGWNETEIGKKLKINQSTVHRTLSRAMHNLTNKSL